MVIRVNNELLRGDYGYVSYIKKHNAKVSVVLLIGCISIFVIGLMVPEHLRIFMNIFSVLLILPAAQFIAKFLGFYRYQPLEIDKFNNLKQLSEDFLVLGELPIIRGKQNYFLRTMIIAKTGVYVLVDGFDDVKKNRRLILKTTEALTSIIKPKGFKQNVIVFNEYEKLYMELETNIKPKCFNTDDQELGVIAREFILKTQ